jgi:ribulose-5-phosphate 4-epimerase/fuculose-1-phosphate aldolase
VGAGDLDAFLVAGKTLFSLGLVKDREGSLSTWDGNRLLITRTGCELAHLTGPDVLEGTLDEPSPEASSDLERHVEIYRANGAGAVAHGHPPGSVPEGGAKAEEHGSYAFGESLREAVSGILRSARRAGER